MILKMEKFVCLFFSRYCGCIQCDRFPVCYSFFSSRWRFSLFLKVFRTHARNVFFFVYGKKRKLLALENQSNGIGQKEFSNVLSHFSFDQLTIIKIKQETEIEKEEKQIKKKKSFSWLFRSECFLAFTHNETTLFHRKICFCQWKTSASQISKPKKKKVVSTVPYGQWRLFCCCYCCVLERCGYHSGGGCF